MEGQGFLTPFVFWAQNKRSVFLKVDLQDVQNPEVKLEESKLEFTAYGRGAKGPDSYKFTLDFFSPLDTRESKYRVLASQVQFTLMKQELEWWPKLLSTTQKLPWLKVDFDRWKSQEEEEEEEEEEREMAAAKASLAGAPKCRRPVQTARQIYLLMYNLWQFIGYVYILSFLAYYYFLEGPDSLPKAYERVGLTMRLCQMLQFFEIVHPLLKFTKGSVMLPIIQVGGRAVVLFMLIHAEPRMQDKPVVFYLFVVWSLIEIFRYPCYMARVYGLHFGLLTWLRYTAWIPLYPLGFICEGVIILRDIPYFEETLRFSIYIPGLERYLIFFPHILRIYLLCLYFPLAFVLMKHMYRQRVKKIGPPTFRERRKTD